jgi:hypothetical protein
MRLKEKVGLVHLQGDAFFLNRAFWCQKRKSPKSGTIFGAHS